MMSRFSVGLSVLLVVLGVVCTHAAVATDGDVNPADPSTWDSSTVLQVGGLAPGFVYVSEGSDVVTGSVLLGDFGVTASGVGSSSFGIGLIRMWDAGSTWQCVGDIWAADSIIMMSGGAVFEVEGYGYLGSGPPFSSTPSLYGFCSVETSGNDTKLHFAQGFSLALSDLRVIGGAEVVSGGLTVIGDCGNGFSFTDVSGVGSILDCEDSLYLGEDGGANGFLRIKQGGLVAVRGETLFLGVGDAGKPGPDTSAIEISTGGMLAKAGNGAGSIEEFLGLISGTDRILYGSGSVLAGSPIGDGTIGVDYTLEYIDDLTSNLNGCTVLTVGVVPEPGTIALILTGLIGLFGLAWKRRQ